MSPYKINIKEFAGDFCGDGDKASLIKITKIDPLLNEGKNLMLDFTGVRSMNSSFSNALIANLIGQRGIDVLQHVSFHGCNEKVKVLIEIAVELGLKRNKEENHTTA